jgi:hypothetical protein
VTLTSFFDAEKFLKKFADKRESLHIVPKSILHTICSIFLYFIIQRKTFHGNKSITADSTE